MGAEQGMPGREAQGDCLGLRREGQWAWLLRLKVGYPLPGEFRAMTEEVGQSCVSAQVDEYKSKNTVGAADADDCLTSYAGKWQCNAHCNAPKEEGLFFGNTAMSLAHEHRISYICLHVYVVVGSFARRPSRVIRYMYIYLYNAVRTKIKNFFSLGIHTAVSLAPPPTPPLRKQSVSSGHTTAMRLTSIKTATAAASLNLHPSTARSPLYKTFTPLFRRHESPKKR